MDILTSKNAGILTIEFNRPDKKNAITAAMYLSLAAALKDAETDASVRVILFTGKPTIFTAGNDLDDFLNNPPNLEDSPVFQFLNALAQASKPMVAAVCGGAIGIGTTLLLHCDLVYAAENAKFALPFTSLGLCPEAASSLLLPQLAGYQRAAEKLLLGEPFLAAEAREMGLVNQVLPLDQVQAHAMQQAAKLVALPAASIRLTRRLMRSHQAAAVQAQMMDEGRNFRAMLAQPEAKEAFTAFFEKRKPNFAQFS